LNHMSLKDLQEYKLPTSSPLSRLLGPCPVFWGCPAFPSCPAPLASFLPRTHWVLTQPPQVQDCVIITPVVVIVQDLDGDTKNKQGCRDRESPRTVPPREATPSLLHFTRWAFQNAPIHRPSLAIFRELGSSSWSPGVTPSSKHVIYPQTGGGGHVGEPGRTHLGRKTAEFAAWAQVPVLSPSGCVAATAPTLNPSSVRWG
jgi:hypothetical protein